MGKKTNIALIGFMGTGKSHYGKILADRLNFNFIEMDALIVEKNGKSIPEIFASEGEIRFRELEMAVCREAAQMQNSVIACGGGVILNKLNIDYLKQNAIIFCMEASDQTILSRIMKDGKEQRPLLNKPDPQREIENIMKFRRPLYQAYGDSFIDTEQPEDKVVFEICKYFKNQ